MWPSSLHLSLKRQIKKTRFSTQRERESQTNHYPVFTRLKRISTFSDNCNEYVSDGFPDTKSIYHCRLLFKLPSVCRHSDLSLRIDIRVALQFVLQIRIKLLINDKIILRRLLSIIIFNAVHSLLHIACVVIYFICYLRIIHLNCCGKCQFFENCGVSRNNNE